MHTNVIVLCVWISIWEFQKNLKKLYANSFQGIGMYTVSMALLCTTKLIWILYIKIFLLFWIRYHLFLMGPQMSELLKIYQSRKF